MPLSDKRPGTRNPLPHNASHHEDKIVRCNMTPICLALDGWCDWHRNLGVCYRSNQYLAAPALVPQTEDGTHGPTVHSV
jgi:hypothetical protein